MTFNITFLIPRGEYAPSGVRRALDYEPLLEKENFKVQVVSYNSVSAMSLKQRIQNYLQLENFYDIILGVSDRIARIFSIVYLLFVLKRNSHFIIQWVLPPLWFVRILKKRGVILYFDFDDAVFLKSPDRVDALVRIVDKVIAGSHFNLEYAQARNSQSYFIPTPVPYEAFSALSKKSKRPESLTIGWVGGPFTTVYLSILEGPLRQIAQKYPNKITFTIIGAMDKVATIPKFEGIDLNIIPRIRPAEVPRYVSTFDIGVMPLFDRDFEKGKCALKALEYMAAGVPAVCSAVGENNFVIADGENGFLASTDEEWFLKLDKLISDNGFSERIGLAGQKTIENRYSTAVCSKELLKVLGRD